MSYEQKPSVLIARQGYSGLGDGVLEQIGAGIKGAVGGALQTVKGIYTSQGEAAANAALAQQMAAQSAQNQTPSWVVPAAVGSIAIVAILLLRRKKA